MPKRSILPPALPSVLILLLCPIALASEGPSDPAAALRRAISAAESGLRDGEFQVAESHYRSALLEGWLLVGTQGSQFHS